MPNLRQVGLKPLEIAIDDVHDVCVGNCRGCTLVLAQISDYLVRQRDTQLRVTLLENLAHP